MASTVSHSHLNFSLPTTSSHIAVIPTSDFTIVADRSKQKTLKILIKNNAKISIDLSPEKEVSDSLVVAWINGSELCPVSDPSKKNSLKIRLKMISNNPSLAKEGGDSSVTVKINRSKPSPIIDPSKRKLLNIRIKNHTKISNDPSLATDGVDSPVAARINGSELAPTFKVESLPAIKTQPTQAQTDQPVININDHVSAAAKKNQIKRRFSVTLSRKEIDADIAEIKALGGLKRLRRPKKLDQPCWNVDQRQLDHLFPGLGYC